MPRAIQKVWERIFQEWLPATGFEHADGPELEVYLPGDPSAQDYQCEIWIPIVNHRFSLLLLVPKQHNSIIVFWKSRILV